MCMLVTLAYTSDQDRVASSGVNPRTQTASIASAPIKLLHNLVSGLKFRPIRTGTKIVEKVHDLLDSYYSTHTYTYRSSIDSDGDGISNVIDLDDDNDGIPDLDECINSSTSISTSTVSGSYFGTTSVVTRNMCGSGNFAMSDQILFEIIDNGSTFSPNTLEVYIAEQISGSYTLTQTVYLEDIIGDMLYTVINNDVRYVRLRFNGTASMSENYNISVSRRCGNCSDSDNDGIINSLDLDSDNDGIYDLIEAGHKAADTNVDGRIDGTPANFGTNGLFDVIETAADSDEINYTISNSEITPNTTYDAYELDSDGDGCFDTAEADISDSDEDGIAGTGTPSVLPNGLIDGLTYTKPSNSSWHDHSTTNCSISCESGIDSDGDGIGDDCDLDDDNDGIPDLAECPSTASGLTGPLMTFTSDISSTDPQDPTVPHILNSITHNGNTFTDFLVPKSFKSGLSLTSPSSVVAVSNSTDLYSFSSNPNFETDIIDLFNTRDLGKYLELDGNNFSDGDFYELFYDSPIVTTLGGYIAITERNGNNRQVVQPIDADGNLIGSAITIERAHYVNQGVTIDANGPQNSWIALYPLEDLAPLGTLIFGLRVSFSTNNTYDGPDAKVFIFGDAELLFCDADNDGIPNQADLDSDNDGIYDLHEAGHAAVDTNNDGIIDGAPADFGTNGLFDGIETAADNGTINYAISDSESAPDGTYDAYELDSDGDGCFDTDEEDISDSELDGLAGTGTPTVDAAGLVTTITYTTPPNNIWQNPNLGPCLLEICNNGIDDDGDGNIDYLDSDCDCISGVTNNIKLNFSNHTNTIGTGLNLGDQILYENTSILEGRSIDIIATVISLNNITALDEHQNTADNNALVKIPSMNTGIGTYYSADIRYDLVESGTKTPITASFEIEIQDLDKRGNRTEYISVIQSESDYYYLSDPTNIVANFNGGLMTMEGSQDQRASDIEGSVKFVFIDQNSFTLTYGSLQDLGASTGAAGFSADGNDFSSFPSCLPRLEDCTNGIDDDGDGFIDCADGDCPSANAITRIISN